MWTWAQAILAALGVIRDFFSWKRSADDRQAGADSANASTRAQNAERVAEARKAEEEAEREHRFNPDDDSGFDQTFRRD